MTAKIKGMLWAAFSIAVILGMITAVPTNVGATPLPGPFQFDAFGNGLVLVNVTISEVGTAEDPDYKYDYQFDVTSPANLYQVSIGLGDVDTLELYTVKEARFSPPPEAPSSRLTANSLILYFLPSGLGVGVDFPDYEAGQYLSITYDSLIEDQYITVRTVGTGGSTKTITARYTEQYSPVPEPMTLLLLGCGLVGLRLLSRRKG